MSNMKFTSVEDALPTKECWCLVWISKPPSAVTSSKMVRMGCDKSGFGLSESGYLFSKFRPTHSTPWSVETCGECVEYWMELPEDPGE